MVQYIASDVVPVGGILHHGCQACKKNKALFRIMPIDSIKITYYYHRVVHSTKISPN
jgi:hypothetical protein